jgi:hypothetical protein
MLTSSFCPVCKFKNKLGAEHCSHCGTRLRNPLPAHDNSTEILGQMPSGENKGFQSPPDYLNDMPHQALALFVMGAPAPLLLENFDKVILGRTPGGAMENVLDLSDYGAHQRGVSRRHALISYKDGCFEIEDLNSANGTRINQKRLIPGIAYPLDNNAVILMGELWITVQLKLRDPGSG